MQEVPVSLELFTMNLSPRLDESLLRSRETASDALDRVNCKHGPRFLIVSMKMWTVVRRSRLNEHSNDNSKEPRDLRHERVPVFGTTLVGLTDRHSPAAPLITVSICRICLAAPPGAVPVSPPCAECRESDVAMEPPQSQNAATDSPISTNRKPPLRRVRARWPRRVRPFERQNDSNDSCGSRTDIPPADRHDGFCDFALRPCS